MASAHGALLIVLLLAIPAMTLAAGTDQPHIPTVTRLVALFTTLETNLLTALDRHDSKTAQRLLAADFEQRSAARPGDPTPRADWLHRVMADMHAASSIEQMAVHDLGDTATVSFLWRVDAGAATQRDVFVVDVWRHVRGDWLLQTRYAAPADTLGNGVPGASTETPVINKKY